jgi:hypothetical protein
MNPALPPAMLGERGRVLVFLGGAAVLGILTAALAAYAVKER